MTVLAIDVHGDDLSLFSAFTCLRDEPLVVVVNQTVPTDEIDEAMSELGLQWRGWDQRPHSGVTHVIAPAYHPEGHLEHNVAAGLAADWRVPITFYATYAPRGQRTRTDNEVPYEPWMVARKLRALSCFESQIEQESTRPWFTYLLDIREWYA